jgi:hypothetical protein
MRQEPRELLVVSIRQRIPNIANLERSKKEALGSEFHSIHHRV